MNGKTHMIVGGLSAGIPVAISISLKELGFDIGNCIYFWCYPSYIWGNCS